MDHGGRAGDLRRAASGARPDRATRVGIGVVLDLGRLSFLDVAGTHALLETADRLRAPVAVRRPSRAVQRVLSVLQREGELPVETV